MAPQLGIGTPHSLLALPLNLCHQLMQWAGMPCEPFHKAPVIGGKAKEGAKLSECVRALPF